jgi:hypothetical protein
MKHFGSIVLAVFIAHFSFSQYYTPGTGVNWNLDDLVTNSNSVLTYEDGNYFLWNWLYISQNDTISITSDEEVRISNVAGFATSGVLLAQPPSALVFTATDSVTHFEGFNFTDSDGSILKKCTIEFGGGISLNDSDITIDSCTIRNSNQTNSTGAIDMINSNPVIRNSQIFDNLGPAVLSSANGNSSPQIIGNKIIHNCASNLNMPQINLGTSSLADSIRIIGNMIIGFYDNSGGIAVATLAGGSIKAIIRGNIIDGNRYGITAYGYNISTIIENNLISNNNIQGDPMLGGSGINFWGDASNISIVTRNEIYGNLWGVTIQNHARPNLGQVETDTVNYGANLIYDNGNEGEIYDLYNNTPDSIYAENNFWGTFDPYTVELFIYHQPDNTSLGFVDYLPIKDYFTGINEFQTNGNSYILIFPNPAKGKISFKISEFYGINHNFLFRILDITGVEVKSGYLSKCKGVIEISGLHHGTYTFQVLTSEGWISKKFLKQ